MTLINSVNTQATSSTHVSSNQSSPLVVKAMDSFSSSSILSLKAAPKADAEGADQRGLTQKFADWMKGSCLGKMWTAFWNFICCKKDDAASTDGVGKASRKKDGTEGATDDAAADEALTSFVETAKTKKVKKDEVADAFNALPEDVKETIARILFPKVKPEKALDKLEKTVEKNAKEPAVLEAAERYLGNLQLSAYSQVVNKESEEDDKQALEAFNSFPEDVQERIKKAMIASFCRENGLTVVPKKGKEVTLKGEKVKVEKDFGQQLVEATPRHEVVTAGVKLFLSKGKDYFVPEAPDA